jgi:hypothetical protein
LKTPGVVANLDAPRDNGGGKILIAGWRGSFLHMRSEMSTQSNPSDYSVVWPRSPRTVKMSPNAKRLDSLKGKTIAQLSDYVFRGDEIFPIIEEEISKRFPDTKFVNYQTFGKCCKFEEP